MLASIGRGVQGMKNNGFDARWWLAMIAVVGAFTIQGVLLLREGVVAADKMPSWIVGLVTAVVGYYYIQKGANGNGNGGPPKVP